MRPRPPSRKRTTLADRDRDRRLALLEAALREILRLDREAATSTCSVPFDVALDGALRDDWLRWKQRASRMLAASAREARNKPS